MSKNAFRQRVGYDRAPASVKDLLEFKLCTFLLKQQSPAWNASSSHSTWPGRVFPHPCSLFRFASLDIAQLFQLPILAAGRHVF